ncbi:MAG: hypothetical protein WDW36_003213 [Sanguina aurantia]
MPTPESVATAHRPQVHWGLYRASTAKWHQPPDAVPPGSTMDPGGTAMASVMVWDPAAGGWTLQLRVPCKLLPLYLGMWLYHVGVKDVPRSQQSHQLPFFSVPLGLSPGSCQPLGPSIASNSTRLTLTSTPEDFAKTTSSVNFALYARHASMASIFIVRAARENASGSSGTATPGAVLPGAGVMEIVLDPRWNRSGDVWHICVEGLRDVGSLCYGWRLDGSSRWESGGRHHPGFVVLDPYATLAVQVLLPKDAHKSASRLPPPAAGAPPPTLLGSLAPLVQQFDWQATAVAAQRPAQGAAVLAEVDVRTFTDHPDVQPLHRGKLLGVLDRLELLQRSGVNTLVLAPLNAPRGGKPLSFLSPDPELSSSGPLDVGRELKTLVRALHSAGIHVIMQIEFCMTAQSGDEQWLGLSGIDKELYYRRNVDGGACVLNTGQPAVQELVIRSLKHWAVEYQLDGFVILNAENLAQDAEGRVLDSPPLAEAIALDPQLSGLRILTSVSNAALLPRSGVRGFPHYSRLGVWNDGFTRDLRSYITSGSHGSVEALKMRITGSPDLLQAQWGNKGLPGGLASGRLPSQGVNAPAGFGGLSLLQLANLQTTTPEDGLTLAATLLLLTFLSMGEPCVSGAALASSPQLAAAVSVFASLRRKHAALLTPVHFDAPSRDLRWHSTTASPGSTAPGVQQWLVHPVSSSGLCTRCAAVACAPGVQQWLVYPV